MNYLMTITLSPIIGQALVEKPVDLLNMLDSISERASYGYVVAGSRQATLMVAADTHEDLALLTVPWCILTGEHPTVVPLATSVESSETLSHITSSCASLAALDNTEKNLPLYRILFSAANFHRKDDGNLQLFAEGFKSASYNLVNAHHELGSDVITLVVTSSDVVPISDFLFAIKSLSPTTFEFEPIIEWHSFLDTLRKLGGLTKSPATPPVGCCDSPKCCDDIRPFAVPKGGVDELNFTTWDTIEIPGVGEQEVELSGTYQIERKHPTSSNWRDAEVEIEMKKMDVKGHHDLFGEVRAFLLTGAGKRSYGTVKSGTIHGNVPDAPKHCEMNASVGFEIKKLGLTVAPRQHIVLTHNITHIPPVGQGGGTGDIRIPLYDVNDNSDEPVAYLKRVRTHIGDFCHSHKDHH